MTNINDIKVTMEEESAITVGFMIPGVQYRTVTIDIAGEYGKQFHKIDRELIPRLNDGKEIGLLELLRIIIGTGIDALYSLTLYDQEHQEKDLDPSKIEMGIVVRRKEE